jgi:hypothetical protein
VAAVFPFGTKQITTTQGFDALLFVQLNYKMFRHKQELIELLNGDLEALDGCW